MSSRAQEPLSGRQALTVSRAPMAFERNEGQFPPEERFVSRSGAMALILTDAGATFRLGDPKARDAKWALSRRTEVAITATMTFRGAALRQPHAEGVLPSVAHYLIGNDPSRWRTSVPQYATVRYSEIYPGIDVVYRGDAQKLEYDLIVAPKADPGEIRLILSGGSLSLDRDGNLTLQAGGRTLLQHRPVVYQDIGGQRRYVRAKYALARNGEVGIELGKYDRLAPLVIDPALDYAALVGGSGKDGANYIAVDSAGNSYIAGSTSSADLGRGATISGGLRGTYDAFVSKLGPTGNLIFTTYLGGGGDDVASGIAVNSSGTIFVGGLTDSTDYPRAGSASFAYGGRDDGFFTILNSTGASLIASTYYGGAGDDVVNALALDANSNVYVAGHTTSNSIPGLTSTSVQGKNAGGNDAFVAKFSAAGSLLFSTFYGGAGDEEVYAATTDSLGDGWITGSTLSPTLPGGASGARSTGHAGFIFRIASSGSALRVSQSFGGAGDQVPFAIAVDSSGLVWVAGKTNSRDYPTTGGAIQKTLAGDYDGFVTAFVQTTANSTSALTGAPVQTIAYSTYVGGSGTDIAYTIATGRNQTVYVGGYTASASFLPACNPQPAVRSTFLFELSFPSQAVILTAIPLAPSTPSIPTAFYLKAQDVSNPVTVAVRAAATSDEVFLAGYADDTLVFPASSQGRTPQYHGGVTDAFVVKLANASLSLSLLTTTIPALIPTGVTAIAFRVANGGPSAADNVVVQFTIPAGVSLLNCAARFLCSSTNGIVSVTYPTLAAATSDVITLQLKAGGVNFGSLQLNASLTSATNNTTPGTSFSFATLSVGPGQPPFVLNPADTLEFQNLSLGEAGQRSVSLTAAGAVDIQLTLEPKPSTAAGVFTFPQGTQTNLSIANTLSIPLVFKPNQVGPAGALLTVKAPNASPAYTTAVELGGNGTTPSNVPNAFLPHIAVGGGFVMGFYVLNNSSDPSPFRIAFYDDRGNALSLPIAGSAPASTLSETLGPSGARYYEAGTFDGSYASGWGAITAGPSITISAILRRRGSDGSYYEAAIPATPGYNDFQIPFDATTFAPNGAQIFTGFAVANVDATTATTVTCTARDASGNVIPNAVTTPPLNGYGHWADYDFPRLIGLRGTLDCHSATKAGALALRFIGTNSMSSLPVVTARPAGGATGGANAPTSFLPHFAVGGGFVTGFYVLNNSATASTFSIQFYGDEGNAVAVRFAGLSPNATLSDTVGPSGARYYEAGTFDDSYAAGWGAITAGPAITISAILRRRGSDGSYYEAAVPATAGYNEFQIPFDATTFAANGAQIFTGFAIANLDASTPGTVTCTARDSSGSVIAGAVPVPALNKYGHWADYNFPRLNGMRGTLDCASTTKVGGLALRFIGTNSMSSLPVTPIR